MNTAYFSSRPRHMLEEERLTELQRMYTSEEAARFILKHGSTRSLSRNIIALAVLYCASRPLTALHILTRLQTLHPHNKRLAGLFDAHQLPLPMSFACPSLPQALWIALGNELAGQALCNVNVFFKVSRCQPSYR